MYISFPGGLYVCTSRILLPWYVHQFLHGGFCYVHSFGCVLHSRQFRCAVVDLSGVAARPAMHLQN